MGCLDAVLCQNKQEAGASLNGLMRCCAMLNTQEAGAEGRLTGRDGGLADMKRLAPPADEGLPPGPAAEPGLPACKEAQTDHPRRKLHKLYLHDPCRMTKITSYSQCRMTAPGDVLC